MFFIKKKSKVEKTAEDVSKDLNVILPIKEGPLLIRLIALFTLIGGLSIMGSLFTDIVRHVPTTLPLYALRVSVGVLAIAVSYGIITKKVWTIWLYGLIVLIGFFRNPLLSILPALVLIYLLNKRNYFNLKRL